MTIYKSDDNIINLRDENIWQQWYLHFTPPNREHLSLWTPFNTKYIITSLVAKDISYQWIPLLRCSSVLKTEGRLQYCGSILWMISYFRCFLSEIKVIQMKDTNINCFTWSLPRWRLHAELKNSMWTIQNHTSGCEPSKTTLQGVFPKLKLL